MKYVYLRSSVACGILVGAFNLTLQAGTAAPPVGAPDPRAGAPQVDAFYSAPSIHKPVQPGRVIRKRSLVLPELKEARAWKVIYQSRSLQGKPIAVSGVVLVPRKREVGKKPAIIAWGHGTVGFAPHCAPSRSANLAGYLPLLREYIKAGYAVAATDYEGIGVPGNHPYLVGSSEGRSMVDSVRAAQTLDRNLSDKWFAVGHSQGGHAALFAGQLGRSWGKGLDLRGVVSYAPPSQLSLIPDVAPNTNSRGLYAMVLAGLRTQRPNLRLEGLVSGEVVKQLDVLQTRCSAEVNQFFNSLPKEQFVATQPGVVSETKSLLNKSEPGVRKTGKPILILHGEKDSTLPAFVSVSLSDKLREAKENVQFRKDPKADHITIIHRSHRTVMRWLKKQSN